MKYLLIFLFGLNLSIASETNQTLSAQVNHTQNMKEIEKVKNWKRPLISRLKKRLKRIKNKRTHDHHIEMDPEAIDLKKKRRFKALRFLEVLKNKLGPVRVKSIETENPNLLLFEVTGKTRHFSLESAKYQIAPVGERIDRLRDGQIIDVTEIEDGKYNLSINISNIEVGEHKIVMAIKYKLGRRQKRPLIRLSKAVFEKVNTDSAHAVLTETFVHESNSRVVLDMKDSYSDFGNIISYTVETIKDGLVISTENFDPEVSGTSIFQAFFNPGSYQIKLTVTDDAGDTDSTLSNTYIVVNPAPSIQFTATQNPEFPDVFEFDLTGTKVEGGELGFVGVYIARSFETSGGEYIELDFVPLFGDRLQNPKFSYKTPARGEIFVGVFAESAAGVNNFYDFPGVFNIPDQPKESIFFNLSHTFDRSDRPYTKAFAFNAEIDESEVQEFKIKVVDSNGTINQYSQVDPNLDSGFFHVDVDTKGPGDFDVEITLILKDGRESLPFKTSISFDEVDFGVATLSMTLQFPDQFTSNKVGWIVDLDNSNPGNFGYFNNFYCDFTDVDSGNKFRIEREWTNYDFLVERGNYNVLCFGETTAGLTSSNELKFSIDARNKSPIISSVQSNLVDQNFLKYAINIEANDPDGFIQTVLVKERYSNGTINEFDVFNYLEVSAQGLPNGDGFVDVELIAVDKEGARSEPYNLNIEFNNLAPSFDIVATLIDENTKEYRFDFQMSDDGYIERQIFTMTSPNGNIYSFDTGNTVNQFLNEATGIWTVQVEGIDNLGKSTIKSIQVDVINKIPEVLALNIYPVNENERLFEIVPDVVDYDGYFIADELIITYPSGNTTRFTPGTGPTTDKLFEPGNYLISYRAQDNSGDWSDVFTTNYSVINKAPIAVFEITQISQDRWFVVTESSYDEDGFIIEHRFEFNGPKGEYITRSESGSFDIQLASPGIWNVGYDVKDNDNEWSERINSDVEVINENPTIELSYELINPSTRTYKFDVDISDDFGDVRLFVKTTDPNGVVEEGETAFPFEKDLILPGTWYAEAKIVDSDGAEVVTSRIIEIINQPPVIELSYLVKDEDKREFEIYAKVEDDFLVSQAIDIKVTGPGGFQEYSKIFTPQIISLNAPGEWKVEAIATDSDNEYAISEVNIIASNKAPVISAEIPNEPVEPLEVFTLDASQTYDPNGDGMQFQWIFEDGTIDNSQVTSKFFEAEGQHIIKLRVGDTFGETAESIFVVDVDVPLKPIPEYKIVTTSPIKAKEISNALSGELYFEAYTQSSQTGYSYEWEFSDGIVLEGANIRKSFEFDGDYTVILKVRDAFGQSRSFLENILYEKDRRLFEGKSECKVEISNIVNNSIGTNEDLILVAQDCAFSEGYHEYSNNSEFTELENYILESESRLVISDILEEGENTLAFRLRDSENRLIEIEQTIVAGSLDKAINVVGDLSRLETTDLSIHASYKGSTKSLEFQYLNGSIDIQSVPNFWNVYLRSKEMSCYFNLSGNVSSLPDLVECSSFENTGSDSLLLVNSIDDWIIQGVSTQLDKDKNNQDVLRIGSDTSFHKILSRDFIYQEEKSFLRAKVFAESIPSGYQLIVKLINLDQGISSEERINSGEESNTRINANQGDAVHYEVVLVESNRVGRFDLNLKKSIESLLIPSAYAVTPGSEPVEIVAYDLLRDLVTYEFEFMDLNRERPTDGTSGLLGGLDQISVGKYSQFGHKIFNEIFGKLTVRYFEPKITLRLKNLILKQGDNTFEGKSTFGENYCTLESSEFDQRSGLYTFTIASDNNFNGAPLLFNGSSQNCFTVSNLSLNSSPVVASDFSSEDKENLNNYQAFFKIEDNSLNANEEIEISVDLEVIEANPIDDQVVDIFTYSSKDATKRFGLSSLSPIVNTEILVKNTNFAAEDEQEAHHNQDGNHYNELNIVGNRIDKGDFWLTPFLNRFVAAILQSNDAKVRFGDASNINGGKYFHPHVGQWSGSEIDIITKNFRPPSDIKGDRGSSGFGFGAMLDLFDIFQQKNVIDLVGEKRFQVKATELSGTSNLAYLNQTSTNFVWESAYANTCVAGETVKAQISNYKDHGAHFDFDFSPLPPKEGVPDIDARALKTGKFNIVDWADYSSGTSITSIYENGIYDSHFYITELSTGDRAEYVILDERNKPLLTSYPSVRDNSDDGGLEQILFDNPILRIDLVELDNNEDLATRRRALYFNFKSSDLNQLLNFAEGKKLIASRLALDDIKCSQQVLSLKEVIEDLVNRAVQGCDDDPQTFDPVIINEFGGLIEREIYFNGVRGEEGFIVSNGARLCGSNNQISNAARGGASGSSLILKNVIVGEFCDSVIFDGGNLGLKKIENSEFCSMPLSTGRLGDLYFDDNTSVSDSVISGSLMFASSTIRNSLIKISGSLFVDRSTIGSQGVDYKNGYSVEITGGSGDIVRTNFNSGEWKMPVDRIGMYRNQEAEPYYILTSRFFTANITNSKIRGFSYLQGAVVDSTVFGDYFWTNKSSNSGFDLVRPLWALGNLVNTKVAGTGEIHPGTTLKNSTLHIKDTFLNKTEIGNFWNEFDGLKVLNTGDPSLPEFESTTLFTPSGNTGCFIKFSGPPVNLTPTYCNQEISIDGLIPYDFREDTGTLGFGSYYFDGSSNFN